MGIYFFVDTFAIKKITFSGKSEIDVVNQTATDTPIVISIKLKQSIQSPKQILNFPNFSGQVESFIFQSDLFILDLPPNVKHTFQKAMNKTIHSKFDCFESSHYFGQYAQCETGMLYRNSQSPICKQSTEFRSLNIKDRRIL